MTELEKLEARLKETGGRIGGFTPGPKYYETPADERAELVAKEINKVFDELSDPVKGLIAEVRGEIFSLEDSIMCKENQFDLKTFEYVEMTPDQKYEVQKKKRMVDLLNRCVNMMEQLNNG